MMTAREIKDNRIRLKLTQKQLSALLGCNIQTVQAWEQGTRHPGWLYGNRLKQIINSVDKPVEA
jgi:DNA-binding transcriptional regulator YiaG